MEHKKVWQGVNTEQVEQLLASDDFIHKEKCGCGFPIYTFRVPGEVLEGRLRPCKTWDRADRARTAELSYYLANGQEFTVAIRLSKWLWQTVNENHLWGQWIRITYVGSVRGKFPNAMKVYQVDVDKGAITEDFRSVENAGNPRNSKARKQRKIRRPAAAGATATAAVTT